MLAWYKRRGADAHASVAVVSFFAALANAPYWPVWMASFATNTLALFAFVWWHDKETP